MGGRSNEEGPAASSPDALPFNPLLIDKAAHFNRPDVAGVQVFLDVHRRVSQPELEPVKAGFKKAGSANMRGPALAPADGGEFLPEASLNGPGSLQIVNVQLDGA